MTTNPDELESDGMDAALRLLQYERRSMARRLVNMAPEVAKRRAADVLDCAEDNVAFGLLAVHEQRIELLERALARFKQRLRPPATAIPGPGATL